MVMAVVIGSRRGDVKGGVLWEGRVGRVLMMNENEALL